MGYLGVEHSYKLLYWLEFLQNISASCKVIHHASKNKLETLPTLHGRWEVLQNNERQGGSTHLVHLAIGSIANHLHQLKNACGILGTNWDMVKKKKRGTDGLMFETGKSEWVTCGETQLSRRQYRELKLNTNSTENGTCNTYMPRKTRINCFRVSAWYWGPVDKDNAALHWDRDGGSEAARPDNIVSSEKTCCEKLETQLSYCCGPAPTNRAHLIIIRHHPGRHMTGPDMARNIPEHSRVFQLT